VLKAVDGGTFDFVLLGARGGSRLRTAYSGNVVWAGRRDWQISFVVADGQGACHLLLGPRLTAFRKGSSAVGRTRFLRQGNECWLEGMDLQPASDAWGKIGWRALQLQEI